jgi:hypothetical protein
MPTLEELEKAFSVYFDEIERCRKTECYWALLHVVVALPDICAALESDDGRTSGAKYVSWCNRFPATEIMNGDDWWEVRCLVLHQGAGPRRATAASTSSSGRRQPPERTRSFGAAATRSRSTSARCRMT